MRYDDDYEVEICSACGKRPVAGYVARHGVYLSRLCSKCWLKHIPEELVQSSKPECHCFKTSTGRTPRYATDGMR